MAVLAGLAVVLVRGGPGALLVGLELSVVSGLDWFLSELVRVRLQVCFGARPVEVFELGGPEWLCSLGWL